MSNQLIILLLVFIAIQLNAATIYVSQSGSGDGSGSDASNRKSLAAVNSAWPASAGDILSLSGTFTNTLTVGGSGSAGSPITILFETDAKFSAPLYSVAAIVANAKDYITIDGGSNGLIEATGIGTGMTNLDIAGVGGQACQHLTVQNLRIQKLYYRTSLTDEPAAGGGVGTGVANSPTISPSYCTYFTVSNCFISDCGIGIGVSYSVGCSNYTFVGNTFSNCNWGIGGGDRTTDASLDNVIVSGNRFRSFANWDDTAGNWYHHNGTYIWCSQSATIRMNNVTFSGNTIGPGFGTYATSGMWVDGAATNVLMCNNLVLCDSNDAPNNAMLQISKGGKVLNNTFLGGGVGSAVTAGGSGWESTVMGNLVVNARAFVNNYNVGSLVLDSNLVYAPNISQPYSFGSGGTGDLKTFAEVQAMGYELNTITNDPLVNADGTLQAGSPAIGAGANFYSLFTTDKNGNPRPSSGAWTIGAFEYGAGGGGTAGQTVGTQFGP